MYFDTLTSQVLKSVSVLIAVKNKFKGWAFSPISLFLQLCLLSYSKTAVFENSVFQSCSLISPLPVTVKLIFTLMSHHCLTSLSLFLHEEPPMYKSSNASAVSGPHQDENFHLNSGCWSRKLVLTQTWLIFFKKCTFMNSRLLRVFSTIHDFQFIMRFDIYR